MGRLKDEAIPDEPVGLLVERLARSLEEWAGDYQIGLSDYEIGYQRGMRKAARLVRDWWGDTPDPA